MSRSMIGPHFDLEEFRSLYPFRSNYLEMDGLRYHYLDEGEGPPVLMLHGNPTWSFFFRELVLELRRDHRVIVPDHMGMGLSDRPPDERYPYRLESRVKDVRSLLDHLGLDRGIAIVAHDWGGVIGGSLAVRNPDMFSAFAFMNTAAFRMPKGKRLPLSLYFVKHTPVIPAFLIRGFNAFSAIASHIGVEKKMDARVRKGYVAPYNSWGNRIATLRFVQDIPLGPKDPSYGYLKATDEGLDNLKGKPMMVIWGEKDFIFDMEILDVWRERFPLATFLTFPDAGHYVIEDARSEVVTAVANFLRCVPDRGDGGTA